MAQVTAGVLVPQNCRSEQALIDFEAAAVTLEAAVFGCEIGFSGHQPRHRLRGGKDEVLDPETAGTFRGQRAIDALDVMPQKLRARLARDLDDACSGGLLEGVAAIGRRQKTEQAVRLKPELREVQAILRVVAQKFRRGCGPCRRGVVREPRGREDVRILQRVCQAGHGRHPSLETCRRSVRSVELYSRGHEDSKSCL